MIFEEFLFHFLVGLQKLLPTVRVLLIDDILRVLEPIYGLLGAVISVVFPQIIDDEVVGSEILFTGIIIFCDDWGNFLFLGYIIVVIRFSVILKEICF
jgi:hypothetical protein